MQSTQNIYFRKQNFMTFPKDISYLNFNNIVKILLSMYRSTHFGKENNT